MSGEFSNRNLVGSFLQFQHLLVYELTSFVNDEVWIERTGLAGALSWLLLPPTLSWKRYAGKTSLDCKVLGVLAIAALDVY